MELNGTRNGKTLNIALKGELDHHSAEYTRNWIDAVLKDKSIKELVIDMKGVTFMDSSGLGVILGRYRTLKERGGRLSIKNANKSIDRIFRMSGIYTLVDCTGM
ncbi:MAG: Anti-sigma F factor antagonist [Firmicutes bacterium ADurb.Bin182]|nr:MAG: Anti-sigma F factor antagonist [Firmicutes bacterium ADurb.Bin182]